MLIFLSPALHYVIPSVSAMHLGNGKDADSDAEEEVMALISMWCASRFSFGLLLLDGLVSALILLHVIFCRHILLFHSCILQVSMSIDCQHDLNHETQTEQTSV